MSRYDTDTPDVVIEHLPVERLDELEPLWHAMLDHLVLKGNPVPIRPAAESWPLRRAVYEEILQRPEAFALVARRDGRPVGYAVVRIDDADPVWYTGDPQAELESLALLPDERGRGLGTRLMDVVEAELEKLGVSDLTIGVDLVNDGALRFYERRGYRGGFLLMYGRPGGGEWTALERQRERPYRSMWLPDGPPKE
jgi:ribosomal protein S18 acetylase RimI-like enzyme